jgi:hypothetical protein
MKVKAALDFSHPRPERTFPTHAPEYRKVYDDETHQWVLEQVGSTNLSLLKFEASKDCNIYNQIDRYNRTGDDSFLGTTVPGFIDMTKMPKTFMDVKNIEAQANQLWAQAPIEIRQRYGHNFGVFLTDLDKKLKDRHAAKLEEQRKAATGGDVK